MHLVSMTMFGSRFSQIIRQKSETVLDMGPGMGYRWKNLMMMDYHHHLSMPANHYCSLCLKISKCITEHSSHNQPCEAMYALSRLYP